MGAGKRAGRLRNLCPQQGRDAGRERRAGALEMAPLRGRRGKDGLSPEGRRAAASPLQGQQRRPVAVRARAGPSWGPSWGPSPGAELTPRSSRAPGWAEGTVLTASGQPGPPSHGAKGLSLEPPAGRGDRVPHVYAQ